MDKVVEQEENYLEKLKNLQEQMPNIILPSMGLAEDNTKIDINGRDYIKESKEEQNVK